MKIAEYIKEWIVSALIAALICFFFNLPILTSLKFFVIFGLAFYWAKYFDDYEMEIKSVAEYVNATEEEVLLVYKHGRDQKCSYWKWDEDLFNHDLKKIKDKIRSQNQS